MKKGILSLFLVLALCMIPQVPVLAGEGDVTFTALDGSGGTGGEGYDKLIDGKKTENDFSKWCVGLPTDGAYIIMEASDCIKVTGYTFTTGNDNANANGRNPKSWVLYGSNDWFNGSATWVTLDTITDDTTMQDANYTDYTFSIPGNVAYYKYYKLCITATQGADIMQLGELTFNYDKSHSHTWGEPSTVSEANCKSPKYLKKSCGTCGATVTYVDGGLGNHPYDEKGECTVCGDYRDGVAKVGGTYYWDLQAAIDAAGNETVILGKDVVLTSTLNITDTVTIDLNGHTITGKQGDAHDRQDGESGSAAINLADGSLTLIGSGRIAGGTGGKGGGNAPDLCGAGGAGGVGICIAGGNLYVGSDVTISGGDGGDSVRGGNGGNGSDGILVQGNCSVVVDGNIIGGNGGAAAPADLIRGDDGGNGGSGLCIGGGCLTLSGNGSITKGNGGAGNIFGNAGKQGNKIVLADEGILYAQERFASDVSWGYKVMFINGSASYTWEAVAKGGKAVKPEAPATCPEGYTEPFIGWYEKENDLFKDDAFDFDTAVNGDITLYAKWESVPQTTEPEAPKADKGDVYEESHSDCSGGSATCKEQAICEYCGKPYGEPDSSNHTGGTEVRNVKAATCTRDGYTGDIYCKGCGKKLASGKIIKAAGHTDADKNHICDAKSCKATISDHSGGVATCRERAVCHYCGEEYGEIKTDNHTALKHVEAKEATTEAEGNIEYWYCEDCGKYFGDKDGKNEISLVDTVIAKLTKTGDDSKASQNDDNSHMTPWLVLIPVSGGALIGAAVYGKKKMHFEK